MLRSFFVRSGLSGLSNVYVSILVLFFIILLNHSKENINLALKSAVIDPARSRFKCLHVDVLVRYILKIAHNLCCLLMYFGYPFSLFKQSIEASPEDYLLERVVKVPTRLARTRTEARKMSSSILNGFRTIVCIFFQLFKTANLIICL